MTVPVDTSPPVSEKQAVQKKPVRENHGARQRNVVRGVWELARLHTKESWLCWYPAVWGACLSAGVQNVSLDLAVLGKVLFGIWISVTATHCAFCTFNDICDRNLDLHVDRCKVRPLPSGMISTTEAVVAFVVWCLVTYEVTLVTLGWPGVATFAPIWFLSAVYPFMKRIIPFPQLILGAVIGGAVFPGWISITQDADTLQDALPLFVATMAWVVYFDVFYATQDSPDDKRIGVKSLAVLLGNKVQIFLGSLGVAQVTFFVVTAQRANMSVIFWVFGVGVWALNIPYHVLSLDLNDRKSGGRIFKANIFLGLYMTIVTIVELFAVRVYGFSSANLSFATAKLGF